MHERLEDCIYFAEAVDLPIVARVKQGLLREAPQLQLRYESDLQRWELHQKSVKEVRDFLGWPPASVTTGHYPSNLRPLVEMVTDIDEVINAI